MKKIMLFQLILCFVLVVVIGCGGVVESSATNEGSEAPVFSVSTLDGNEVSMDTYIKDKPFLLVFFATWCPPCREEVPHLIELKKQFADSDFDIVAVSVDDSKSNVERFLEGKEVNYTVLHDGQKAGVRLYNVVGIPTNILVNKEGIITFRQHRLPTAKEIESILK